MSIKKSMKKRVDANTRIMVIGSMPGEVSLQKQKYYAHKQNNFWKFMAAIFSDIDENDDYEVRVSRLLSHNIGLWDVVKACFRDGSLDSNIKNAVPNDFSCLSSEAPLLKKLLFNGQKAYDAFVKSDNKEWASRNNIECVLLPSTSPANASQSKDDKLRKWRNEVL